MESLPEAMADPTAICFPNLTTLTVHVHPPRDPLLALSRGAFPVLQRVVLRKSADCNLDDKDLSEHCTRECARLEHRFVDSLRNLWGEDAMPRITSELY